ncbi:MAG: hypothetical protein R3308_07700 [Thiohalobacterales bacterium]|nr:hypothetical protein [Thiohalobacterales bacterium]
MFLKDKDSDDLIEVLSLQDLFDPFCKQLVGRFQRGEDPQDPQKFAKDTLVFPSGESLPRCWLDAHYREGEMQR